MPQTLTIASSGWDSAYRHRIHTCFRCRCLREGRIRAQHAVDVLANRDGVLGLARSGCRPSCLRREVWRPVGSSRPDALASVRRGAEPHRRVMGLPQSCEALQSPMVGASHILLPHHGITRISRCVHRWRTRRRVFCPLGQHTLLHALATVVRITVGRSRRLYTLLCRRHAQRTIVGLATHTRDNRTDHFVGFVATRFEEPRRLGRACRRFISLGACTSSLEYRGRLTDGCALADHADVDDALPGALGVNG